MINKELEAIKDKISKIKHPKLSKILESDKIDMVITKIQNIYHIISNKLIVKYNLSDELKQGKIFTILIALLTFILLIFLTLCFAVTLNSIIGIGLIFSFFRQIVFCLKWTYTIIKNKGNIIKKYLSNLFPNSKMLKEEKFRKNIPLYEENILYQIEDFIHLLNKSNISIDVEKEITLKLKNIVNMLNINNIDFKGEIRSLEFKKDIANKLAEIDYLFQNDINKKKKQEDFLELKNGIIEQINEVNNKIYVKKK